MSFHLRPAAPHDVPDLVRLIGALAEYEQLSHLLDIDDDRLHHQLFGARPAAEAMVAVRADDQVKGTVAERVVGFALHFPSFSTFRCRPGLYLEDLFVEPEHRGRGIGKGLLRALAALAVERGCARFEWSVLDWNEPAIRFYQAMGASLLPDWRICRVTDSALTRLAGER